MHEKKLRMIAEAEIPLAIVYVSLDQYCNPKYHFKNLMQRKAPKEDTSTILAVDTQDVLATNSDTNMNSASSSKLITIPETSDFMQDETIKSNNLYLQKLLFKKKLIFKLKLHNLL